MYTYHKLTSTVLILFLTASVVVGPCAASAETYYDPEFDITWTTTDDDQWSQTFGNITLSLSNSWDYFDVGGGDYYYKNHENGSRVHISDYVEKNDFQIDASAAKTMNSFIGDNIKTFLLEDALVDYGLTEDDLTILHQPETKGFSCITAYVQLDQPNSYSMVINDTAWLYINCIAEEGTDIDSLTNEVVGSLSSSGTWSPDETYVINRNGLKMEVPQEWVYDTYHSGGDTYSFNNKDDAGTYMDVKCYHIDGMNAILLERGLTVDDICDQSIETMKAQDNPFQEIRKESEDTASKNGYRMIRYNAVVEGSFCSFSFVFYEDDYFLITLETGDEARRDQINKDVIDMLSVVPVSGSE